MNAGQGSVFLSRPRVLLAALLLLSPTLLRAETLVLSGGTVVDVQARKVRPGHSVVIVDGKILQVAARVKPPAGARVIDCRGKWIMPGLVDAHIHLFQSGGLYTRPDAMDLRKFRPYETERAWVRDNAGDLLARYLAAGITTVIDIGGPIANYAIRDRFNADAGSPTIFLTGPLVSTYQPEAFRIDDAPILQADTPAAAREMVRKQLPYRPDFIKIWYIVRQNMSAESTLPVIQATIDESHGNGLKVAVHATQLQTAKLALKAGADILVHSVSDAAVDDEFIALLRKRNIPYIPTLIVGSRYGMALSGSFKPSAIDLALANPVALGSLSDLKHLVAQGVKLRAPPNAAKEEPVSHRNLRTLTKAGVLIATGTDAGNIGTPHASSYLDELLEMSRAGMSNWEIIQASTLNGARAMSKDKEVGTLAPGMRADVLILDKDPVADIGNTQAVHAVINRGNYHEPKDLIDSSPAALAQRQLNAYNARDIEAFLEPYSEDVKIYNFPDELRSEGKEKMRARYAKMFADTPELHCELVNRIVMGNTVIDQERITGRGDRPVHAIAVYKIVGNKIAEVRFISNN